MKVKRYIGRIVVGWVLIVLGALWCQEAAAVKAPAETAVPGSFMVIGGILAIRSGVRNRRRIRQDLERRQIWEGGVGDPTRRAG